MDQAERIRRKRAYTGPKYETARGDAGSPCKECGITIHWVKTAAGKWMPVEYDGIPHWGFCDKPERFKTKRERAPV